jgi:hypothetical protein
VSDFGDADPEDTWDDGDPVSVRLALLVRIVTAIDVEPDIDRAVRRRIEVVRLLRKLADEMAGGT